MVIDISRDRLGVDDKHIYHVVAVEGPGVDVKGVSFLRREVVISINETWDTALSKLQYQLTDQGHCSQCHTFFIIDIYGYVRFQQERKVYR